MQVLSTKEGIRIDKYLMDELELSRSKIQKMFDKDSILVNNKKVKPSYKVKLDDIIDYVLIEEKCDILPNSIPLDIVYEDDYVIVVNKDNGMVVHPGCGNYENTLVNALMYHFENLSKINGENRPGIVHRIDAYTTGLLMVAKDDKTHTFLQEQLKNKTSHRIYWALVWGNIKNDTGTIDAPIGRDKKDRKKMAVIDGGKEAITHFKVIERFNNATLVELKLETGRTHQIRVHMDYINHPVVNDSVYGRRKLIDDTGQMLHAKELGFIHPKTKNMMYFKSDLPYCFTNILDKFKKGEL